MHTVSATLENVGKYKLGQLELLDSRFKVDALVRNSGCEYLFSAVEPVEIDVSIKSESPERHQEIFSRLNKGELVQFGENELTIAGSPLFDEHQGRAAMLQVSGGLQVHSEVTVVDCGDQAVSQVWFAEGVFSGVTEHYLTVEPSHLPYRMKIGPITQKGVCAGGVGCDFSAWTGQPIRHLQQFDEVKRFFDAIIEHRRARIEVSHGGHELFRVRMNLGADALRTVWATLDLISKARRVAEHFSRKPIFDDSLLEADVPESILAIYGIITAGEHHFPPNVRYTIPGRMPKWYLEKHPPSQGTFEMTYCLQKGVLMPFVGDCIQLGPMVFWFSNARLGITEEEFNRRMSSGEELIDFPIVCERDGLLTMRLMTDADRKKIEELTDRPSSP